MGLVKRISDQYNALFGASYPPLLYSKRSNFFAGVVFSGRNFGAKNNFYGSFPPSILNRFQFLFEQERVLLPYAGRGTDFLRASEVVSIDKSPEANPTHLCDVGDHELLTAALGETQYPRILADPPYSISDGLEYSPDPTLNRGAALQNLSEHLEAEGYIVWMDECIPKAPSGVYLNGVILLYRSTNNRLRYLLFYSCEKSTVVDLCTYDHGYFYGVIFSEASYRTTLGTFQGRHYFQEAVYRGESELDKGRLVSGCERLLHIDSKAAVRSYDSVIHVGKYYPMFRKQFLKLRHTFGLAYFPRCRGMSGFSVIQGGDHDSK